jgi:hypothetical protein
LRADKKTSYHGYNDEKTLKLESLDLLTERCKEMITDVEHKIAEYETLEQQIKIERAVSYNLILARLFTNHIYYVLMIGGGRRQSKDG